jgi:hypothetical protein
MGPNGLADFTGRWRVDRQIADHRADRQVVFSGNVDFVPDERGLFCEERGLLNMGQGPLVEALRRYYWRSTLRGRVSVFFEDMRPFHEFTLTPEATAEHICKPDLYKVRYDFSRWPKWQAVWTVTGPRKDYVSTSDYRRAEAR